MSPRSCEALHDLRQRAIAGPSGWGVDPDQLAGLADEIVAVHRHGVEVAVVVGGGNYFRGRMADQWGISRAEADNIGILGTVMNALMLRGALTARAESDARVMTAVPMQSIAEPFIRLRADRHLRHGLIVLLAGGIGQPYVTTDYPAVQRALELGADALLVAKRGVDAVYDRDPNAGAPSPIDSRAEPAPEVCAAAACTRTLAVSEPSAMMRFPSPQRNQRYSARSLTRCWVTTRPED